MKTVGVVFKKDSGKIHHYKCLFEVEVGDKVIVDTPPEGYKVVEVVAVDTRSPEATEYIIQKVDPTLHLALVQKKERREALLQQLEERKQVVQRMQVYEAIARMDAEALRLLRELKQLDNSEA